MEPNRYEQLKQEHEAAARAKTEQERQAAAEHRAQSNKPRDYSALKQEHAAAGQPQKTVVSKEEPRQQSWQEKREVGEAETEKRREALTKELNAKVEAGRITSRDRVYELEKFENAELARMKGAEMTDAKQVAAERAEAGEKLDWRRYMDDPAYRRQTDAQAKTERSQERDRDDGLSR